MLRETVDDNSLINKNCTICDTESIDHDQSAQSIDHDQNADESRRDHVSCPICFENIENSDSENQDDWDVMIFECQHYVCTSCSIEMMIHDTFSNLIHIF